MNEELDSQLSAMFDDALPSQECELLARRLSRDELLKARSLRTTRPIQVVKRETWDSTYKPKDSDDRRPQQDEATKAWNLHTALYYKAGGVPWRMPPDTCSQA